MPGWRKLLAQFHDPLVILLLIATSVSAGVWVYERDSALPYEAIAILSVVVLNALMGSQNQQVQQFARERSKIVAQLLQQQTAQLNAMQKRG